MRLPSVTNIIVLVWVSFPFGQLGAWTQQAASQANSWPLDTKNATRNDVSARIGRLNDKDYMQRERAANELGLIGVKAQPAIPALVRVLQDQNGEVRAAAAGALGTIFDSFRETHSSVDPDAAAVAALAEMLVKDPYPYSRANAAYALGAMGARSAVPLLLGALKDSAPNVRSSAANVLKSMRPDAGSGIPPLVDALKDSDPSVRSGAADALAMMGHEARSAVPSLFDALKDSNPLVRSSAGKALAYIDPHANGTIPAMIQALKDSDEDVRSGAADALGTIGAEARSAVSSLLDALKDPYPSVRSSAAQALGTVGTDAKTTAPALVYVLRDSDASVRKSASAALARIGTPAVPALIQALKDSEPDVRSGAAVALGDVGSEAGIAIPRLMETLQDKQPGVSESAATALLGIANATRDARATGMIEPLIRVEGALKAASFPAQASQVRITVEILRAIQTPWYEVVYTKAHKHLLITAALGAYVSLTMLWLALIWKAPLWLWRVNEIPILSRKVRLPDWIGGGEASLAHVLVVGFFHYHPRVLDAWVLRHIATARDQFNQISTVQERKVHIEIPIELDRKIVLGLKPDDLRESFCRNRTCLVIWGEGGGGKTSLACQIARWTMSDDTAIRPCTQRILPIIIEQDLNLEVGKDKVVLTEVIRGQLRNLIGEDEAPSEELTRHLLKRKRVLIIVDGLSELNEATRNKIRPLDPEFAANALMVTSRLDETLDEVPKTIFHPTRIQGNRLSSFMEAYLVRCGKRALFDDAEFFNDCSRLSVMVGDRDATALLAKLYAEQMIALKERGDDSLPKNIPDLMLEYLNEVNRQQGGLDNRTVHSAGKIIAWQCLKQTYRPTVAEIGAILEALGGGSIAKERVKYLEENLRIVQTIGAGRDRVKFALDPLAEYLAGLYLVEQCGDRGDSWRNFLAQADAVPGAPNAIRGFLLAVRDCCIAKADDLKPPAFVAGELAMRASLDSMDEKQAGPVR